MCARTSVHARAHVHGEEWGWCRIINTVRVKEHSPELAGGCGRSTQSLGSRVQGGGFKAGLEAEVSLSAQEAEEIGGAWGWAHEHGHLVSVSDLDCTGCLHPGFSINLHGKGFGGVEGDLRALGQPMSSILELGIDLAHLNCTLQPYYFQPLVT